MKGRRRPAGPVAAALAVVLGPGLAAGACGGGGDDAPAVDAEAAESADSDAGAVASSPEAPRVSADGLVLEDLVVAEPVTGERAALYLTVRSDAADTLVAVEAEGAGRGSLHESRTEGGVMRMRPVDGVAVDAGGEARLRPGGYHGMLEDLDASWAAGDTVRLTLTFARAGAVEAPALVVTYADLDARFGGGGR